MFMTQVKNKQAIHCYAQLAYSDCKVVLTGLLLLLLLLIFSAASHADGLFNFQMKMANKGNTEAQFKVGEMYESGFGVKQDRKKAMQWITKAADKGHEAAGFQLLYWNIEKNGLTKANKTKFDALKQKAANANAQAQYYYGKMYAHGVGVRKNDDKAIGWLNKAALVGVLEAEREMDAVREEKQKWVLQKQHTEEKKRAQLKSEQAAAEQQKKLAAQHKQQRQKQQEEKVRTEALRKKQQATTAAKKQKSSQASAEKKAQMLARQQAAEQRRLEEKRQALLKQRAAEEAKRKTEFESNPCNGRSARFLSTCR